MAQARPKSTRTPRRRKPPPRRAPPRRRRVSRLLQPSKALLGTLATAISIGGGAVGLWEYFHNEVVNQAGTVIQPHVEAGSLREWVNKVELRHLPRGYTQGNLDLPGYIVTFKVSAEGWKGNHLPVSWTLYRRLGGSKWKQVPEFVDQPGPTFTPDRPDYERVGSFWVPNLGRRKGVKYLVEIDLHDPARGVLDNPQIPLT